MKPIIDFEQLEEETSRAGQRAFQVWERSNPTKRPACFALCTDDAVMTVFPAACTHEWLQEGENADLRFSPVEWSAGLPRDHFEAVERLLMLRVERQSDEEFEGQFERIAEMTFKSFVRGLQRLRDGDIIAPDVFLTVCSTDPSDHMRKLEAEAVRLLNPAPLAEQWSRVHRRVEHP